MSESDVHFSDRIRDRRVGPCRLLTLETSVDDVVAWRGSFMTNPDLEAGQDVLQALAVSVLDRGTEARDRFELAQVLEDRGATLNVSSDGLYVDVSGRALTPDVDAVVDVMAEMLRTPAFDPDEVAKARQQAMGKVQRSMENTGNQASGALSRRLFGPAHPNHTREPEARLAALRETSADDLRAYHRNHFGATEWTLVFVGDVDHAAIEEVVREAFGDWEGHGAPATHDAEPADTEPGRSTVPLPDKSNVDVRIGHALPLRRDHDDYVALYVGNYILGGNFSARLMSTVRDEKGLTYHIGSRLSGVTTRYAGSWQASVTLSQEKLEAGIEATEAVVRDFVESGAEPDELDAVKTTITGAYKVGLSTTTRLAQSVLTNAERGFDLGYLDRFPDEVNALSLEDVNDAVARYLRPGEMHRALAGTLPEAAGAAAGADA